MTHLGLPADLINRLDTEGYETPQDLVVGVEPAKEGGGYRITYPPYYEEVSDHVYDTLQGAIDGAIYLNKYLERKYLKKGDERVWSPDMYDYLRPKAPVSSPVASPVAQAQPQPMNLKAVQQSALADYITRAGSAFGRSAYDQIRKDVPTILNNISSVLTGSKSLKDIQREVYERLFG